MGNLYLSFIRPKAPYPRTEQIFEQQMKGRLQHATFSVLSTHLSPPHPKQTI